MNLFLNLQRMGMCVIGRWRADAGVLGGGGAEPEPPPAAGGRVQGLQPGAAPAYSQLRRAQEARVQASIA